MGPEQNSGTAVAKLADARMTALEKENAALRQELSRRTACAHECPWCRGSASESDRPPCEGKSVNARPADLVRGVEEIRPSILRAIEKRFGGHLLNNPETRQRMTEHPGTSRYTTAAEKPLTPPLRKQEGEEWKVVASKSARRKEAKERMATDVRNGEKRGKDCGANTAGEAAANAATPGKDDGTTQTEQRRSCNENRTDVGIEDGHAPSHTANVCGDPYAQRGSKNDICRNNNPDPPQSYRSSFSMTAVVVVPRSRGVLSVLFGEPL
jgi:hypothetical protein